MILLDTDHLTLLKYRDNERGARLAQRLQALPAEEVVALSIVPVEEQMRGWLAAVARERQARRQVVAYAELTHRALLLSANRRDFERVPGLRVESWLDEP